MLAFEEDTLMVWVLLIIAGIFEIVWVYTMKQSAGFTKLVPSVITVLAICASLYSLSIAMRSIPVGTAYIVWVGIGALGSFILGILLFGESASMLKFFGVLLAILGLLIVVHQG